MNKRVIIYLLLLAASLVLAVAYLQVQMMEVFAIVLTIPGISLLSLPIMWVEMSPNAELILPQTTSVNKAVICTLRLYNRGILPIPCVKAKLVISYPNTKTREILSLSTSLMPRRWATLNAEIELAACGPVSVELKKVWVYDLFTVFCFGKKQKKKAEIIVLPQIYRMDVINRDAILKDVSSADKYHASRSGEDPTEFMGVRSFRPGDKLQKIHWKLTAKTEELMVKEFGSPISCKVCICIGANERDRLYYHEKMTTVMSLGLSLIEAECVFMLLWRSEKEGLCHSIVYGLEDFYECFSGILRTQLAENSGELYEALDELKNQERFRQVIYVTGDCSVQHSEELLAHRNMYTDEIYLVSILSGKKAWKQLCESMQVENADGQDPVIVSQTGQKRYWLLSEQLEQQLPKLEWTVM